MSDIVGVVLAAGRGTRMGEITKTVPKPLVSVAEVPAIFRVLRGLRSAGISRSVIVTGYLGTLVREALAGEVVPGMKLQFVDQADQLGTGHALKLTKGAVQNSPLLLCFADIMTSAENYNKMAFQFADRGEEVTAAVRLVDDPWRAAAVYFDSSGNISRIVEKPAKGTSTTQWAHAGMYCFSPVIYDYLDQLKPSARGEYEVTDAVELMINDGRLCRVCKLDGYWKDLATPEDVAEAEELILQDQLHHTMSQG